MIVELQLDAETFRASFREQVRKTVACELTEDVFDLNPSDDVPGEPYIIVGYQVGKTSLRRANSQTTVCVHTGSITTVTNRLVNKPQVVQELMVNICWVNDLNAANTHQTSSTSLTLPLVFDIAMDTCGDPKVLRFDYVGLDHVPATDPLAQKLGGKVPSSQPIVLPIDRVIGSYMPSEMRLINGHLSMTDSHECLAVRLEFWDESWGASTGDPARSLPYWDSFYAGNIIDRLNQVDGRAGWSIFLDHYALTGFIQQEVLKSVSGEKGVTVTRLPKAEWFDNPVARVHVDLEVEKENACYCLTEDLDISATITADVYITVPTQDTVRIDLYTNVAPDFWDASCCVLTVASFWPILGFGQMAMGKITTWEYMAGYLPFLAFIAAIVKVNDVHFDAKGKWIKDPNNEDHAFSEDHLILPADSNFGQLSLQGSKPISDATSLQAFGLLLWGGMEVFSPPQPTLEDPQLDPFCWHKASRCSTRIVATSRFRLYPTNPQHWALLHLCDARIIDDPYNMYKLEVQKEEHGFYDLIVSVDFWQMKPDFWLPGKSYPCRLLIKTTGGVRILTFQPLSGLSEEQFLALARQAQLEYVNNCYYPRHRLFEELEWPIEKLIEQPGLYYVKVRAVGLPPGERVDLVGDGGAELARFFVDAHGMLLVTALARQEEGGEAGLQLRRSATGLMGPAALPGRMRALSFNASQPAIHARNVRHEQHTTMAGLLGKVCPPDALGSPAGMASMIQRSASIKAAVLEGLDLPRDSQRAVMQRQTKLEETGVIRLPSSLLSMVTYGSSIFAVMSDRVEQYDISGEGSACRVGAWPAQNVRGAIIFDGSILLWGKSGIWRAEQGPRRQSQDPFHCDSLGHIRGVAVVRERLAVLYTDGVRLLGTNLCEELRRDVLGIEKIVATKSFFVLLEHEGFRFTEADRLHEDKCLVPMRAVTRLEIPPFPMGGETIYAHTHNGGYLVRLLKSGDSEILAQFSGEAWFAGMVRAANTLAYATDGGTRIRLLTPGKTVMTEGHAGI